MRLVNLNDQSYINVERIDEILPWGEDTTRIFMGGSEGYHDIDLPIKKVVDAISVSDEPLDNSESYQVSVSTKNLTSTTQHVTAEQVFEYLKELERNDGKKLTIQRLK